MTNNVGLRADMSHDEIRRHLQDGDVGSPEPVSVPTEKMKIRIRDVAEKPKAPEPIDVTESVSVARRPVPQERPVMPRSNVVERPVVKDAPVSNRSDVDATSGVSRSRSATVASREVPRKPVVAREDTKCNTETEYSDNFQKENNMSEENKTVDDVTILSSSIVMRESAIETEDDMVIHGRYLDGVLTCRQLTITANAEVTGEINANVVKNLGRCDAKMNVDEFYAFEGSVTAGSVEAQEIGVQKGAILSAHLVTTSSRRADSERVRVQSDAYENA